MKIDANKLGEMAHSCDYGVTYAAGDHAWPTHCPGGAEIMDEIRRLLGEHGITLDTRRADLAAMRSRIAESPSWYAPGAQREAYLASQRYLALVAQADALADALAAEGGDHV